MRRTSFVIVALILAAAFFASAQPPPYRFVVLGDSRGSDNGINGPIVAELVPALIAEGPDLVLFSGDLVTDGSDPVQLPYWRLMFQEPLMAAGIGVFVCRGNHDDGFTNWNNTFSGIYALPDNGPAGEENVTASLLHKNALFISLDEYVAWCQINQSWLDEQLAGIGVPHVFAFGHQPAFQVNHVDGLALYPANRDAFWNSLGRAGARVYFCGHDHFYNHARVQDAYGNWIHQYIAGSAGAPLYDWTGNYLDPRVQGLAHVKNYGYMVVDVNGFDVTLTFKERTAPGVYTTIPDTFTYTGPMRGEGVPAANSWGRLLIMALITGSFILLRKRMRTVLDGAP